MPEILAIIIMELQRGGVGLSAFGAAFEDFPEPFAMLFALTGILFAVMKPGQFQGDRDEPRKSGHRRRGKLRQLPGAGGGLLSAQR
jgi:hypothetical protein